MTDTPPGRRGTASVPSLVLACLCALLSMSGCPGGIRMGAAGGFTVMTYNVNYGMGSHGRTVEVIRQADADIVCLQETTPEWETLLRRGLAGRYRHIRFKHQAGAGGQGVLSKVPFRQVYHRRPTDAWHPGWMIRARTPAGPVQLLNVHLRPPVAKGSDGVYRFGLAAYFTSRKVRRAQITEMLGWTDLARPTVILGDFNEPDNGLAISYACGRKGFRNATGEFDPDSSTWQSRPGLFAIHQRLDHVLYSPHLRCTDARVIQGGGSDHRAVVATFERE